MQATLLERLNSFKEFRRVISSQNDQAISTLDLILDYEIRYSMIHRRIVKANDLSLEDKLVAAFHETDFLKMLLAELQPLLLNNFERLGKTIAFKEKKTKTIKGMEEEHEFCCDIAINWDVLFEDSQKKLFKFRSKALAVQAIVPFDYTQELRTIEEICLKINEIKDKKLINYKGQEVCIQTIENHVDVFFAIDPYHQQLYNLVQEAEKKINREVHITENYKNFERNKSNKLIEIRSSFVAAQKVYQQICSEDVVSPNHWFKESIDRLSSKIAVIKKTSSTSGPREFLTVDALESYFHENEQYLQDIQSEIELLHGALSICLQLAQQKKAKQLRKTSEERETNEKIQQELLLKIKEDRERFSQAQKQKTELFRAEINKKREEKKIAKAEEHAKSAIEEPKEPSPAFKNLAMEQMLNELSSRHVSLLRDILENKRGIKYSEVHTLITKHLGGRISEIGNGSSHKRIRLQSYISEMITHSDVTGGMARPHGKAHNSEVLSHFNINLVKSVLLNAKITLEVVAELEKNLEKNKEKNAVNPHSFFLLLEKEKEPSFEPKAEDKNCSGSYM